MVLARLADFILAWWFWRFLRPPTRIRKRKPFADKRTGFEFLTETNILQVVVLPQVITSILLWLWWTLNRSRLRAGWKRSGSNFVPAKNLSCIFTLCSEISFFSIGRS